jgi:hypothetical protein
MPGAAPWSSAWRMTVVGPRRSSAAIWTWPPCGDASSSLPTLRLPSGSTTCSTGAAAWSIISVPTSPDVHAVRRPGGGAHRAPPVNRCPHRGSRPSLPTGAATTGQLKMLAVSLDQIDSVALATAEEHARARERPEGQKVRARHRCRPAPKARSRLGEWRSHQRRSGPVRQRSSTWASSSPTSTAGPRPAPSSSTSTSKGRSCPALERSLRAGRRTPGPDLRERPRRRSTPDRRSA